MANDLMASSTAHGVVERLESGVRSYSRLCGMR